LQILCNGVIQGLLIALMAMGFSIVYNSTGILHVAQGAVYTLSPFLFLSLIHCGLGVTISLSGALLSVVALSMLIERVNHWPLYKNNASSQVHFISSLGIYIILVQVIVLIWGNETRTLRVSIDSTYSFLGTILTRSQVLGGAVSLIIVTLFFSWINFAKTGTKLIALSDNPIQLSLMGFPINHLRLLAFGLSGFFTGLASILIATDVGFDPLSGFRMVLLAIIATIIGGRSSFVGPIVGGVILGVIRSQVVWYASAQWEEAVSSLILVFFLFLRPQGIMGKKRRLEAS